MASGAKGGSGGGGAATLFHDHACVGRPGSAASPVRGAHENASKASGRPAPSVVSAYTASPPAAATSKPERRPGKWRAGGQRRCPRVVHQGWSLCGSTAAHDDDVAAHGDELRVQGRCHEPERCGLGKVRRVPIGAKVVGVRDTEHGVRVDLPDGVSPLPVIQHQVQVFLDRRPRSFALPLAVLRPALRHRHPSLQSLVHRCH